MKYRKLRKYKYQLVESITYDSLPIEFINKLIKTDFIEVDGLNITVKAGYAWDGPSGPTIDTPTFMRGSLVHDALYQLIREGHLTKDYRKPSDEVLKKICIECGMNIARASYVYFFVRTFGAFATKPDSYPTIQVP